MTTCFILMTKQTGGICINWMMTTKRPACALSPKRLANQRGRLEEVLTHVTQMAMGTYWLFMARYEWLLNNPSALSYLIVNKITLHLMDHFNLLILWFQVIMTMHIPGIGIGKVGCGGGGRGEWVDWVKSQRFFERIFEAKCAFPVGWGGVGWA